MTATEVGQEKVARGMGARVLRKEDARLLTGEARFVDDLSIPGALWLGMVRSPFAHARIVKVDVSKALEMPGVVGAWSGADLAGEWAAAMRYFSGSLNLKFRFYGDNVVKLAEQYQEDIDDLKR